MGCLQVGHRADVHEASFADDPDAVAGALDLWQVVRRQEDGPPVRPGLGHERQELALHERIEAARGLIHDEQRLAPHERLDDADFLAIAPRQLPDLDRRIELEPFGDRSPGAARQVAQAGHVVELLAGRERTQIGGIGAGVGHPDMGGRRVPPAVVAHDDGATRRRAQEAEEDADRRRLAGAVRAEESEDLVLADREIEIEDAAALAVALGQADDLDRVGAHHAGPRCTAARRGQPRCATDASLGPGRMGDQSRSDRAAWVARPVRTPSRPPQRRR